MRRLAFLFVLFLTAGVMAKAADVTFKAVAPNAVVMGQQFRLAYTVNAEAKASDLRIPELADFDVLMGPSTSSSMSTQIINGNVSSETAFTFTYILMPKKEGTFNIGAASIYGCLPVPSGLDPSRQSFRIRCFLLIRQQKQPVVLVPDSPLP